jgi:hypothetical protein
VIAKEGQEEGRRRRPVSRAAISDLKVHTRRLFDVLHLNLDYRDRLLIYRVSSEIYDSRDTLWDTCLAVTDFTLRAPRSARGFFGIKGSATPRLRRRSP